MDTRRYAKRQVTWFRGQMKDWTAVAPDVTPDDIAAMMPA
jgi:tRNA dimethylallyltransferase